MAESETFELPEDPWDELLHQGDVFEESVRATPAIVAALERGTDDDMTWLYVLAAMCVGRPERRAERIRMEAKRGAETYRRLLTSDDSEIRAGAIGALVASGAATSDDRNAFAELARTDGEPRVRRSAILALGLEPGFEQELTALLSDDRSIRYAAALALTRLDSGGEDVARVLADGVGEQEAEDVTDRPPWDDLYGQPSTAMVANRRIAELAVSSLLDRLGTEEDSVSAIEISGVLLDIAGRRKQRRRAVVERLVGNEAVWERRAQVEYELRRHLLPSSREELRAWLED